MHSCNKNTRYSSARDNQRYTQTGSRLRNQFIWPRQILLIASVIFPGVWFPIVTRFIKCKQFISTYCGFSIFKRINCSVAFWGMQLWKAGANFRNICCGLPLHQPVSFLSVLCRIIYFVVRMNVAFWRLFTPTVGTTSFSLTSESARSFTFN